MNRKQFGILLVLLIVLGGAGWYVHKNHQQVANAGEQGTGRKVLGDSFPINDITHISIRQGTNEVNLVKKDDVWRVRERADYPANYASISEFLIKASGLKVIQTEEIGASQLGRMQLEPGSGANAAIVVSLMNKDDKPVKTLTLGKKHSRKPSQGQQQQFPMGEEGFADGRYLFVGSETKSVMLVADPLNNMEPKPTQWLDKDFFKIERPKTISATFPVATNSWKIERDSESGEWKLADAKDAEKLDAARASGVSGPFASPTLEDVELPAVTPEALGLDKPTVFTVGTFDDYVYTVKIGAKTNENYPIMMSVASDTPHERVVGKDEKPEDKDKADKAWGQRQKELDDKLKQMKQYEKWTYLVPAWTVDALLKDRKDLLEEKKDEAKPVTAGDPTSTPAAAPVEEKTPAAAPK